MSLTVEHSPTTLKPLVDWRHRPSPHTIFERSDHVFDLAKLAKTAEWKKGMVEASVDKQGNGTLLYCNPTGSVAVIWKVTECEQAMRSHFGQSAMVADEYLQGSTDWRPSLLPCHRILIGLRPKGPAASQEQHFNPDLLKRLMSAVDDDNVRAEPSRHGLYLWGDEWQAWVGARDIVQFRAEKEKP